MKTTKTKEKETYYQCNHCGDELYWNTGKRFVSCTCGKIFVDGCEDYIRVGGDKRDWKVVEK